MEKLIADVAKLEKKTEENEKKFNAAIAELERILNDKINAATTGESLPKVACSFLILDEFEASWDISCMLRFPGRPGGVLEATVGPR